MSRVCANCFQDKIARKFIRQNGTLGDCDFCNSRQLKVVLPQEMRGLFEEVISLYRYYEPAPGSEFFEGQSLAECLADWEIFKEESDEDTQNDILDDIMGFDSRDGDVLASEDWESKYDHWATIAPRHRWPWFADHLKTCRRFIIEDDPTGEVVRPEEWVPKLLEDSKAILEIKPGKVLFRGRLGYSTGVSPNAVRNPHPPEIMGAPPPELARGGRANPEGISFLYCALEPETAIIETGRFPGATVSLRELRARKALRLADLRGEWSVIEPLGTPNLAQKLNHAILLGSLGEALGKPVHPEDSGVEYVPTQYLAEVILSAGYDGICFPSALNPTGTNVVIFDPTHIRISRRGWLFQLGRAEYMVHPDPKFVVRQKRRKTKKR